MTHVAQDFAQLLPVASQAQETGQVCEPGISSCERTNEGFLGGNFRTRAEEIYYHRATNKIRHSFNLTTSLGQSTVAHELSNVDSRMIDILALILHGRGAVKIISSIYHADGNRRSARQQYLNFVAIRGKPRSRPDSL